MDILFGLLVTVGGALLVLGALAFLARRVYATEPRAEELVFVHTSDGVRLSLGHYRVRGTVERGVVLLLPGVAFSGEIFDLGETGLAPWLARQGYDVWVLDFRGRGLSSRPRLLARFQRNWSFADYIQFDLPTALEEVLQRTGREQVHLVGAGLGATVALSGAGSLAYHAGLPLAQSVASVVGIGGVASFSRQAEFFPPALMRLLGFLPLEFLAQLCAPLLGRIDPWPLSLLAQTDNIDGALYRQLVVNALAEPSRKELGEIADWLAARQFGGFDVGREYQALLARIACPVLLIAGPHDRLSPPVSVQATMDALIHAPESQLFIAARQQGLSANYGHLDMLVGRTAAMDVFPVVLEWLDRHAGVEDDAGRPRPRGPLVREVQGEDAPTNPI